MVEPVYLWGEGYQEWEYEREPWVPNLDCMTIDPEELAAWGDAVLKDPARAARYLFGRAGKGQVQTARLLGRYARHKASAMRHRLSGRIGQAVYDEHVCDAIYEWLPDYARSW